MTWICAKVTENYLKILREVKYNERPEWTDPTRGILVALVQERPTIWNAKAKFIKDDVLSSFNQIAEVLSKMDKRFNIWAIVEKWCWMVEMYIRSNSQNPPKEWRYNNSLFFLKEFSSPSYPYLRCISSQRLLKLTEKYENMEGIEICKIKIEDPLEGPSDLTIFRGEMAFYEGETENLTYRVDVELAAQRAALLAMAPKKRGRPPKDRSLEKKQTYEESNCFKTFRLSDLINTMGIEELENVIQNQSNSAVEENENIFDEFGFSREMYDFLILKARDRAELWHIRHPDRQNTLLHETIYDNIAAQLISAFNNPARVEKFDGEHIRKVWESITTRFYEEEQKETISEWKHFPKLHFLSHRVMPAFLYDSVYLKNNGTTTSNTGLIVDSPQPDAQMSSSSPVVFAATGSSPTSSSTTSTTNHKTIEAVLEQLIAKNRDLLTAKSVEETTPPGLDTTIAYNDLQRLFCSGIGTQIIKQEVDDDPPPTKIPRTTSPSSENGKDASNSNRVTIVNEPTGTLAKISTWVPPKEDLPPISTTPSSTNRPSSSSSSSSGRPSSSRREESKRANGSGEKTRKTCSGSSPNGLGANGNASSLSLANPTIAQALLQSGADKVAVALNKQSINNKVDIPLLTKFGEKKWHYLASLLTEMCREVEIRDPVLSCYMFKEIQTILFKYQLKSVLGQSADVP